MEIHVTITWRDMMVAELPYSLIQLHAITEYAVIAPPSQIDTALWVIILLAIIIRVRYEQFIGISAAMINRVTTDVRNSNYTSSFS